MPDSWSNPVDKSFRQCRIRVGFWATVCHYQAGGIYSPGKCVQVLAEVVPGRPNGNESEARVGA